MGPSGVPSVPRQLDATATALAGLTGAVDAGWMMLCGCLVFMMQAGFTLVESGSCRQKNTASVIMKNAIDASCGAMAWYFVGYGLAFGEDSGGMFGTSHFFASEKSLTDGTGAYATWFFQWTFAAATATIVSGALAERAKIEGYAVFTCVMCGIIQPIVVHWAWSGEKGLLYKDSYLDFAGSGVIHMLGGVAALVGSMIIGPRTGRFDGTHSEEEFAPSSILNICIGTFLLWFGWFGFNAGSTLALSGGSDVTAARCMCTTVVSAAFGGLAACAMGTMRNGRYDICAFANGILSGLVGITAGCSGLDLFYSMVTGLISGVLYDLGVRMELSMKVDDPVGAFPVHGLCGAWGVLAAALFNQDTGLLPGDGTSMAINIQGIIMIAVWGAVTSGTVFVLLKGAGMLRVDAEAEKEGLDSEFAHSPRGEKKDMVMEMQP